MKEYKKTIQWKIKEYKNKLYSEKSPFPSDPTVILHFSTNKCQLF